MLHKLIFTLIFIVLVRHQDQDSFFISALWQMWREFQVKLRQQCQVFNHITHLCRRFLPTSFKLLQLMVCLSEHRFFSDLHVSIAMIHLLTLAAWFEIWFYSIFSNVTTTVFGILDLCIFVLIMGEMVKVMQHIISIFIDCHISIQLKVSILYSGQLSWEGYFCIIMY